MDTKKELNSEQDASNKMEDGTENLSQISNPEFDTPIQPKGILHILKERESVKDEPHVRMEVENDGQATVIAQEDKVSLCRTSLKINRKVTYRETTSQAFGSNIQKCNKLVDPDCQKGKTMSSKRKEVLTVTKKPFLHFQQQNTSCRKNEFQPESQNIEEDKSRILGGGLKKKNDDSIGGFSTKTPLMSEVVYQPVTRKRVLGDDNPGSCFLQSTYDAEAEDSGPDDDDDSGPDDDDEYSGPDDDDEYSEIADAPDTETKSDYVGNSLTKSPSVKVDRTSANQLQEVSTTSNKLSSSSQSSFVPLIHHDTTTKSECQNVTSPEEVWANFLSSLKTSSGSMDRTITGGATRQNVEALESKDDGFEDPTKRERDSTGNNFGNLVNSKRRQNVESSKSRNDGFIHTTKREKDSTGSNFGNPFNTKIQNVEALESRDGFKDPTKRERDNTFKNFENLINTNVTTKQPSNVKNKTPRTQYRTKIMHSSEYPLSRFSQSASKPMKIHVPMKSQSKKVRSAEDVWTHFRLHLTANMESFDRIFTHEARLGNVETSKSVYHSLKSPINTARDSASQNSGELVKIKTENARSVEQKDVRNERPKTLDVTLFIYAARINILKKVLFCENHLIKIQDNYKEERDMEKKIKYLIKARDLGKKLHACVRVLYDEEYILKEAKAKAKLKSPENDLSDVKSLVHFPMSARHIKSFSVLFLYLYRSLYSETPVENIFEKIDLEKCLSVYQQFQEHNKIRARSRNELENTVFTLADRFNAASNRGQLKFDYETQPFQSDSLEEYQRHFDHLRTSFAEKVQCLKELISLGSLMMFPVIKHLSQSRRQLLKDFTFLDKERLDVFNRYKNVG